MFHLPQLLHPVIGQLTQGENHILTAKGAQPFDFILLLLRLWQLHCQQQFHGIVLAHIQAPI